MSTMRSLITLLAILCLFGIAGRMDYQDQMEMQAMQSEMLTTQEAAKYLGLKKSTLDCWRGRGKGPVFNKFESCVRYTKQNLDRYIEESFRTSTAKDNT